MGRRRRNRMSYPPARDERHASGAAPTDATNSCCRWKAEAKRWEPAIFSLGSLDPKIESRASAEETTCYQCATFAPFFFFYFAISPWPSVLSLMVPYAGHRFRNDVKPQTATTDDEAGGSADSPTSFPCHSIDTPSVRRERKDRHEGVSCTFLKRISRGRPFHSFWA